MFRDWTDDEINEFLMFAQKHSFGHHIPFNYCECSLVHKIFKLNLDYNSYIHDFKCVI